MGYAYKTKSGSVRVRDHMGDVGASGKIILKSILGE
jgi:hypothetical protein